MKVLVIPPSYFDENRTVGGGERYALEYAKALSQLTEASLGLFHTNPKSAQPASLERCFRVRHLRNTNIFPATLGTIRDISRFDVVHAMIFPSPLTDLVLGIAMVTRIKVVLTDIGGGIPSISTRVSKLSQRLDINRRAAGLAHLSQYAAIPYGNWRLPQTVLYGGISDESALPPDAQPGGYALFVGRLLPHKGVLELIRAVSADIPLRVVGRVYDDAYFHSLKSAAEGKRVSFFTSADDDELNNHYRSASVVIQPSLPTSSTTFDRSELLGLVALEGMHWGKPVIVTNTASLPELMIDGQTGTIVPADDATALNEAISKYVCSPELSRKVGLQARSHAVKHYCWSTAATRGLAFYNSLKAA
ncbi:MAG: glycosyltransferase family 4 protein [Pirellulales bacterium]